MTHRHGDARDGAAVRAGRSPEETVRRNAAQVRRRADDALEGSRESGTIPSRRIRRGWARRSPHGQAAPRRVQDTILAMRPTRSVSGVRATRISVLIADDHGVLRTGLRVLLEAQRDMVVVEDAPDGRTAVAMTKALHPDVVVIDVAMPLLNGLEATRQILDAAPATRVLSATEDGECVRSVLAMGACGYVIKRNSFVTLTTAIRAISNGGRFVDPLVEPLLNGASGAGRGPGEPCIADAGRLTSRQTEVLQLIAEGKCNKESACELGVSIKTIEKHRQNLMMRLDIHDVAGLTRYAIAARVVDCPDRNVAS